MYEAMEGNLPSLLAVTSELGACSVMTGAQATAVHFGGRPSHVPSGLQLRTREPSDT